MHKCLRATLLLSLGLAATAQGAKQLSAAGATFPASIYQKWFGEFQKQPGAAHINYESIGSGKKFQEQSKRRPTTARVDQGDSVWKNAD